MIKTFISIINKIRQIINILIALPFLGLFYIYVNRGYSNYIDSNSVDDTGAFYTMIDEDKTGNLIPIDNVDILADKIEYYINNQDKLKEMSKYCIDKVNNDFTIEMEAYRINKVYDKIWLQ